MAEETITDLWKQIEEAPGPLLMHKETLYEVAWRDSERSEPFVLIELEYDLGISADALREMRCDFLPAGLNGLESDGFWLLMQRAIAKDPALGRKYEAFWKKIPGIPDKLDWTFTVSGLSELAAKYKEA